jgi:hypothetical protein
LGAAASNGSRTAPENGGRRLFKKTKNNTTTRTDADVMMMDNILAIFRCATDTRFYIVGSTDENEIILNNVLDALYDALTTLLRGQLEARNL